MTIFDQVKAAVAASPEAILRGLGVEVMDHFKGQWAQCKCPVCSDSSGSASITPKGFLHCHQCAVKLDLFQWLAQKNGGTIYEACAKLAAELGVEAQKRSKPKRAGQLPTRMDEDVLDKAIDDLWSLESAAPCRQFLADRKLDSDPELLGELGVGFCRGYIVFAQRDNSGNIQERFRGYLPGGNIKWQWFGRGTGGPGIWLAHRPVADRVLLLEGEWDVLTAIVRLGLHEAGWTVATWTAGASSSPSQRDIPKSWRGKEVHICYDNDVFQGPKYDEYYFKDGQEAKVIALRKMLLTKIAPTFVDHGCQVFIRQIPIDPKVKFGGDFRDWVDAGGIDLKDIGSYDFSSLPQLGFAIEQLDFDELWDNRSGQRVSTRTQVTAIAGDDLIAPTVCVLKCQLGQLSCCNFCAAPRYFPDGIVRLDGQYQEAVALGIANGDMERFLLTHVIKKPKACPEARLSTIEGKATSHWAGARPGSDEDTRQRSLDIVSTQPPSLSGEVDISGHVYSNGSSIVFYADKVDQLDKAEIDLGYMQVPLKAACPHDASTVEEIDAYMDTRWKDISSRVTRVHGRRDIHIACELLFHSVTGISIGGKVRRGWLDIALIGDTRTGKSMTIRGLIQWLKLGSITSAVDNISRAGLVMGADKNGMMRPGLMTKSHRKLLALDEFHWLVNAKRLGDDHPMSWLQSARDEGRVYGVKIYGDRALPAKVRLVTISNWAHSRRRSFTYACEHLGWLYGSPETLSRLDFGVVVQGQPTQTTFDPTEEVWTRDLAQALVLRAWAQEPNQVIVEPDAEIHAFDVSESWRHLYAIDRLPLYTPEEKPHSLLRVAASVANLCFSHPKDDPYSVVVRKVHVEWAAEWISHLWAECQYDKFSAGVMADSTVDAPFEVEKLLTVALSLEDPTHAPRILKLLMDGVDPIRDGMLLGFASDMERSIFFKKGARINALTSSKDDNMRGRVILTDVGHDIAVKLVNMAINDHEAYVSRYRRLADWSRSGKTPEDIMPLSYEA